MKSGDSKGALGICDNAILRTSAVAFAAVPAGGPGQVPWRGVSGLTRDPLVWLGAECLEVAAGGHLRISGRGGGDAGACQDVEAEVAAAFGPFVVLLGQDGADEADQGVAAGEDAHDVGAAADLAVEPFLGYLEPEGRAGL
jgi:hypothetical protein